MSNQLLTDELPPISSLTEDVAVFSPAVEAEIDKHISKYPVKRSAILPLMFIVQRERGFLDAQGITYLAKRLDLTISDIWETATFYSMIAVKPRGKYHLQICRTLSCRILGSDKLTSRCSERLGIKTGETTPDGRFTLSEVECIGSCGTAPALQIGFDFYEDMTPEKVDEVLDLLL
ncbi:MAG: NADH-quinone oxidoreductase subunit NuoE [Pyrinomonadaceae bacterium]